MGTSRTYVITGVGGQIGAAIRATLEQDGHRVIGVGVHRGDVLADLSTAAGRAQMVESVAQLCDGTVDGVIAAAGALAGTPVDIMLRMNYFGTVATFEGLRPLLEHSSHPRAVAISSVALLHGPVDDIVEQCLTGDEEAAVKFALNYERPGMIYGAAKRALGRWIRRASVNADWAGNGITINAVAPGFTRAIHTEQDAAEATAIAAYLDPIEPRPLLPFVQPEHFTGLVAWLTGPHNANMTGQTIFVDGGTEAVLRGDNVWAGHWPEEFPSYF